MFCSKFFINPKTYSRPNFVVAHRKEKRAPLFFPLRLSTPQSQRQRGAAGGEHPDRAGDIYGEQSSITRRPTTTSDLWRPQLAFVLGARRTTVHAAALSPASARIECVAITKLIDIFFKPTTDIQNDILFSQQLFVKQLIHELHFLLCAHVYVWVCSISDRFQLLLRLLWQRKQRYDFKPNITSNFSKQNTDTRVNSPAVCFATQSQGKSYVEHGFECHCHRRESSGRKCDTLHPCYTNSL